METNDILTRLNKEQQEAVLQTEGPVLILAVIKIRYLEK